MNQRLGDYWISLPENSLLTSCHLRIALEGSGDRYVNTIVFRPSWGANPKGLQPDRRPRARDHSGVVSGLLFPAFERYGGFRGRDAAGGYEPAVQVDVSGVFRRYR